MSSKESLHIVGRLQRFSPTDVLISGSPVHLPPGVEQLLEPHWFRQILEEHDLIGESVRFQLRSLLNEAPHSPLVLVGELALADELLTVHEEILITHMQRYATDPLEIDVIPLLGAAEILRSIGVSRVSF